LPRGAASRLAGDLASESVVTLRRATPHAVDLVFGPGFFAEAGGGAVAAISAAEALPLLLPLHIGDGALEILRRLGICVA
jgi:hypothetical protein